MRATKSPIHAVSTWVRRQPPKVKVFLAVASGITALVLLKFIVHDHDNLFVAAESVHSIGISLLIYKLTKEKTCAGTCFDLVIGHFRIDVSFAFPPKVPKLYGLCPIRTLLLNFTQLLHLFL
ncbi:hypothetical protein F2Q69_00062962 [Brassica cretica]|uniref:Uncharacterized protein n=1 Tax=Brassica cretica TaxID=69181 RepID=A0A8S9RFN5_BRACR|nr:hypothetical protein F2Q69_00062962 [Brassica cretica]